MAAVLEFTRQHPEVTNADFRLLMEVAARTDPDTGEARVSVRKLAAAVHHDHDNPGATWRRLRACEARGWLERQGTGRQGRAELRNTETYRLTVAATATVTVAATATARVAATATDRDKDRRSLTPQQRLAIHTADTNLRAAERSPNGERPGDVPPSPDPSRLGSKLPRAISNQQQATKEAPAGNLIPFQARPSDAGTRRGATRTQSREPPGDTTGDPVPHPDDGRRFEFKPATTPRSEAAHA